MKMARFENSHKSVDYFSMEPWNRPPRFVAAEVPFVQASMIYSISKTTTHFGVLNLGTEFTPYNISQQHFFGVHTLSNLQDYSPLAERAINRLDRAVHILTT